MEVSQQNILGARPARRSRAETMLIVFGCILIAFVLAVFYVSEKAPEDMLPVVGDTGTKSSMNGVLLWSIDAKNAPANLRGSYFYDLSSRMRGAVELGGTIKIFRLVRADSAPRVVGLFQEQSGELLLKMVDDSTGIEVWRVATETGLLGSLAVDPSGRWVSYSFVPETTPKELHQRADMWLTVLFDTEGAYEPRYFNGLNPTFAGATFAYLNSTGIQIVDTISGNVVNRFDLATEERPLSAYNKLSGSAAGGLAVLLTDETSEVKIFKLLSPTNPTTVRSFSINGKGIALSPDGKSFAVQVYGEDMDEMRGAGRVDIYSADDGMPLRAIDLSNYEASLYLSDWTNMMSQ